MNAIEELRNNIAEFSVDSGSSDHDAKCIEWYMLLDRIESEYIELPRDKDGEVIHLGCKITWYDSYEKTGRGEKIVSYIGDGGFVCWDEDEDKGLVDGICSKLCTLVNPDSWEQILTDTLDDVMDYCSRRGIIFTDADDAEEKQKLDLIRRCKELAWVE